MADYIRREDALFALRKAERGGSMTALTRLERAYAEIQEMHAADVAEVVHGEWETNSDRPDSLICSVCKCGFDMWKHDPHNYCPNCGARMDGGEDRAVS